MRPISWRHFDFWLFGAVAFLTIFGVTMIRSAIAGNIELVEANTVTKQIIFALVGVVIMVITAMIDYRYWGALSTVLFLVTFGALGMLYLVGGALFGSSRWFAVGPILIQPSELAKITIILILANFFAQRIDDIKKPWIVLQSLLITLGIVSWIIIQLVAKPRDVHVDRSCRDTLRCDLPDVSQEFVARNSSTAIAGQVTQ
jgi:rod shape determining protein RodA